MEKDPGTKSVRVCKTISTCKNTHMNVDDTDTEDDADAPEETTACVSSNVWIDEWKLYLNTHEDLLEGMGIVRWWGVSGFIFSAHNHDANTCLDKWLPISHLVFARLQLPCRHGILCIQ
jgi:hypothetical protein